MTQISSAPGASELLRRRRHIRRKIAWRLLFINAAALLLLELYTLIEGAQAERDLFVILMGVGNASRWIFFGLFLFLIVGGVIGYARWRTRKVWTWYIHPASPVPSEDVLRVALSLPFLIARLNLLAWVLLVAVSVPAVGYLLRAGIIPDSLSYRNHITLSLSLLGLVVPITAVLCYFVIERIWQPEVPRFFAQTTRTPHDITRSRMTMQVRLIYTMVLGVFPMVLLAVEAYKQAARIAGGPSPLLRRLLYKEVYLLATWVVLMIAVAMTIGRSFVSAIAKLCQHMQAVRGGTLDVHMPVASNDEFGDLAEGFNAMVSGLQQEEVVRRLFNLYVTPEVAEHAIVHGAELGGQVTDATVLFADIRGFTTMTEKLGPEAILALLNRYFDAMSEVIIAQKGMVNKFGGDSLLAIFGTPLNPATDHAARATHAAQGMLHALDNFNADQAARREPEVRIGIGIATGTVVAGNVGSTERLEYTVIGDTVNLASRLEGMTKSLPGKVLLNDVAARAIGTMFPLEPIGTMDVRGKSQPVPVYTLTNKEEI